MEPVLLDIKQLAANVQFHPPQIPISSTCLGRVIEDGGKFSPEYLRQQTRERVRFQQAVEALTSKFDLDTTLMLELGPAPTCAPMIVSILNTSRVASVLNPKISN